MLNDLRILKKIKEGDICAFERLFKHYYAPLCIYADGITKDENVSEEIVQEVFYTLWRKRENLNLLYSLKSYLYKAVYNRALQHYEHMQVRERHREAVLSGEHFTSSPLDPQHQLEYNELEDLVNRTLQKLPERRLLIFQMHRFDGMKYSEIASALTISIKTVEAEMTKALQTLRKEVEIYTRKK